MKRAGSSPSSLQVFETSLTPIPGSTSTGMINDKFPDELLHRIFILYIGEPDLDSDNRPRSETNERGYPTPVRTHFGVGTRWASDFATPMHLARTCHRWRAVAFSTPELWKWADVVDADMGGRDLDMFKTWVNRSRGQDSEEGEENVDVRVLLHLSIYSDRGYAEPTIALLKEAFKILQRCRTIRITLSRDIAIEAFSDKNRDAFLDNGPPPTVLEEFEVEVLQGQETELDHDVSIGPQSYAIDGISRRFCQAPKLTKARWHSSVGGDVLSSYLPCSQLTTLALKELDDRTASGILERFSELRNLSIGDWISSSPGGDLTQEVVVFTKLKVIRFGFGEPTLRHASVPSFFQRYSAPLLEELIVERACGKGAIVSLGLDGWSGLVGFLETSGCRLRRLVYSPPSLTAGEKRAIAHDLAERSVFGDLEGGYSESSSGDGPEGKRRTRGVSFLEWFRGKESKSIAEFNDQVGTAGFWKGRRWN